MSLADQLPSSDTFAERLSDLLGDDGSGLSGVLNALQAQDISQLSGTLITELRGLVGVDFPEDTTDLIQVPLNALPQLLAQIPSDPSELTGSLVNGFSVLQQLFTEDVLGALDHSVTGLINIQDLIGRDTAALVPVDPGAILDQTTLSILNFLKLIQERAEALNEGFLDFPDSEYSVETWFTSYAYNFINGIETYFGRGVTPLFEKYQLQFQNILDSAAIKQIHGLKEQVISFYGVAKAQIEGGNTDVLAQLQAVENYLAYLRNYLVIRIDAVQTNLNREEVSLDRFKSRLGEEYNHILDNALLEMSGLRERLNSLFQDIANQIESINLEEVSNSVNSAFEAINSFVSEFSLDQLREALTTPFNTLKESIQTVKDQVLFVIVDLRNLLTEFRDTLNGLTTELGSFDDEGQFYFAFETALNDLLNQLRTNLNDSVKPAIDNFRDDTLGSVFQQVENILTPTVNSVEGVRSDIESFLQDFLDFLGTLSIEDTLNTVRDKLEEVINQLGPIEFDPITEPVIEEIGAMEEKLRQIDVSSLSELTRGALEVSVEVFTAIDFDAQITDVLLEEMDTILNYPKEAMQELVEQIESVKDKLDLVTPGVVLAPLSDIYEPVSTAVGGISIDQIAAPLNAWHQALLVQLDHLAPAQLLKPLVDVYEDVLAVFDQFDPGQLILPIQAALDEAESFFDDFDLSPVTEQLSQTLQAIQGSIDNLNPATLLDPLIEGFEAINEQLEQFDPAVMLAPIDQIVDSILSTVPDLSGELLNILKGALESFSNRIERINPTRIFEHLNNDFDYLNGLFEQLNPQQIIAELHAPYQELQSAYQASGIGSAEMEALLDSINPLTVLSELSATFQGVKDELDTWQGGFEPGALVSLHETLQPKLVSFLPLADAGELTFDFITTFLQENKPSTFLGGLNTIYETLHNQLNALNPQQIKEGLQETFDQIEDVLCQLDVTEIVEEVEALFDEIKEAISDINLQVIEEELVSLMADVRTVLEGLDPRVLIAPLEVLSDEIKAVLEGISPQELLAPLEEVLNQIREGVLVFAPATFEDSLSAIYDEIKRIIDEIDVRIVLQPLTDKLDELHDELEEELTEVGQAFEAMVRAVPV